MEKYKSPAKVKSLLEVESPYWQFPSTTPSDNKLSSPDNHNKNHLLSKAEQIVLEYKNKIIKNTNSSSNLLNIDNYSSNPVKNDNSSNVIIKNHITYSKFEKDINSSVNNVKNQ